MTNDRLVPVKPTDPRFRAIVAQAFAGFDPETSFFRQAKRTCLLLMQNDVPVGAVTFDDFDNGSAAVRAITITPEHRGQGHAVRLGSLIDDFARTQNVEKLCLNATAGTELYSKWGFSAENWGPEEIQNPADAVQMSKTLHL
jgi:N-acetylglutamate synthase-like GNAT family acetyltransferase